MTVATSATVAAPATARSPVCVLATLPATSIVALDDDAVQAFLESGGQTIRRRASRPVASVRKLIRWARVLDRPIIRPDDAACGCRRLETHARHGPVAQAVELLALHE